MKKELSTLEKAQPIVNAPSNKTNGATKEFWSLHSISPKKSTGGFSNAPQTPKELEQRARAEREKARLDELGLKMRNPKIAHNPPDPKPKPFTKKQIPLIASGTTD